MPVHKIIKIISWTAVILWMAFIFNLSSQVAEQSNELSTGITEIIVEAVERVAPQAELDINTLNHIVRKNAHFLSYLVLGIVVLYALRRSGVQGYKSIAIAAVVCILYAVSDEIHQLFVPGREGQIKDVLIDSSGSAAGIVLYLLVSRIFKREAV